jgi:hypothetical protein
MEQFKVGFCFRSFHYPSHPVKKRGWFTKKKKKIPWILGVCLAQVVEHLPNKCGALSSNTNTSEIIKKGKKKQPNPWGYASCYENVSLNSFINRDNSNQINGTQRLFPQSLYFLCHLKFLSQICICKENISLKSKGVGVFFRSYFWKHSKFAFLSGWAVCL